MPLPFMKPLKGEYESQSFNPGMGENQYGTPFTIDESESVTSRNLTSRAFPAMQVRPGRAKYATALTTPNGIGARDNTEMHVLDGTVWKAWGGSTWNTIKSGLTSARANFIDFSTAVANYTIMSNGVDRYAFSNTLTAEWVAKTSVYNDPPPDSDWIPQLAVYNNKLYAITNYGKLLEWNGTDAWILKAPKNAEFGWLTSLIVYNGSLYAGTHYRQLYKWNDVDAWVIMGGAVSDNSNAILSLTVYNGKLYATENGVDETCSGTLLEWNDVDDWVVKAPAYSVEENMWDEILSIVVYNNKLYAGTDFGRLLEWNDVDKWIVKAYDSDEPYVNCLAVHNNKLYAGTDFSFLEWNDVNTWVVKSLLPLTIDNDYILCFLSFNGILYAGTDNGNLFEWNLNTGGWIKKADASAGVDEIINMVGYEGKIYGNSYTVFSAPVGPLLEWNGTTVTELTQAPLTRLMATHRQRLFALINREIKFTAALLPNDWTTALQAGTIYLTSAKSDGTAITSYADHIVVFTSDSMHEVHGVNYDTFQLVDISEDGCTAERTLIELNGVLYFLDESEFKAYAGSKPVVISQKVQNYLKAIPSAYKYKACCGKLGKYLYLSIPYGAVTENNLLLEYDTELKQWYPQTGSFVDFVAIGEKLYGVDATGVIWDMDNGTTDGGTAITWYKESGAYTKSSVRRKKNLQRLYVLFDQPVGSTFTISTSATVDASDFVVRKTLTASATEQNQKATLDANILGFVDWFRLKFSGTGMATIHAIEQVFRIER